MKLLSLPLLCLAASAASSQVIQNVTPSATTRSGRIVILGNGFGTQEGQVLLNGGTALVVAWSDNKIIAYVPETAVIGQNQVKVSTSGGQSNPVGLGVSTRSWGNGPVRWTFVASAPRVQIRPESGPDGTIYVGDLNGHLYALTATGGLKWIAKNATGDGAISVDSIGNIYTGGDQVIRSYDKTGALRWTFVHGAQIEAGPNIGPDGNLYVATRNGLGAFVLSPSGSLLWNDSRVIDPPVSSPQGNRISFAGGNWSFVMTPSFYGSISTTWSFKLGGGVAWSHPQGLSGTAASPDGSTVVTCSINQNQLNSFWPNGSLKWSVPFSIVGKATNTPVVATDGNVYLINQRSVVHALNSGGSQRWNRQISFNFDHPTTLGVRPDGRRVIAMSSPSLGQKSAVVNMAANGSQVWRYEMPFVGDYPIIHMSEIGFSRDQSMAIVGTSHNEYALDPTAYVFAFDTSVAKGTPIATGPVR